MLIIRSQLHTFINSMKINLTFILNGFSWDTFQTAPFIVGTHQEDAMQDDEEQQRRIHG